VIVCPPDVFPVGVNAAPAVTAPLSVGSLEQLLALSLWTPVDRRWYDFLSEGSVSMIGNVPVRRWPVAALIIALLLALMAAAAAASPTGSSGALGTQSYQDAPGVQVVLNSVTRTNGTLTVKWSYRNTSKDDQVLGAQSRRLGPESEKFSLTWDAYLLDGTTKIPVLLDDRKYPVAGTHAWPKAMTLAAGQQYATWAKFEDPGADTKTITVVIPGADPFENVPIS